jgi:RNA polymerase sigma factor (TIGR02999 family)
MAERGSTEAEVTELLRRLRNGDPEALSLIVPLVYGELRELARRQLAGRRPGRTLNTTALVHEAYLKLVDVDRLDWADRRHFLAVAATAMRQIIVDHARRRCAQKRGGGVEPSLLAEGRLGMDTQATEILAIDQALGKLSRLDERLTRTVELRFFAGLTVEETARVLGSSERTVKRDWQKARALLHGFLASSPRDSQPLV